MRAVETVELALVVARLLPCVLQADDVGDIETENSETEARVIIQAICVAVEAAIDAACDHFEVVAIRVAVQALAVRVPLVPVPDRRKTFPRIGVDEIGVLNEVGRIEPFPHAPLVEGANVTAASNLDWAATTVLVAVAVFLGGVTEIGAGVVALLRRCRAPNFAVIPERSALMHQL
ncbi:hypothetical protein GSF67_08360 [Agrobacterium sp. CGMCC 11546]|nr:hypothetical protein GSF67_08360 [Agrobacterium sp. CGMCC 11546]